MKVTDPEIIRSGERDLIDAVKDDLDWDAVREILKKKIDLSSLSTSGGEIIVHENQVAFRVDLALNMELSLMFDRDGNHIPEKEESQEKGSFSGAGTGGTQETGVKFLSAIEEVKPHPEEERGFQVKEDELFQEEPVIELNEFAPEELDLDGLSSGDSELDLDDLDLNDDGVDKSLDEDIDEILKESREFWENKKE